MDNSPREELMLKLQDTEYLKLYGIEQAKVETAIKLARARILSKLTQKELSEKLDISQPYIAKLEQGEANPTLGKIGEIFAAMGYRLIINFELFNQAPMEKHISTPDRTFYSYQDKSAGNSSNDITSLDISIARAEDTFNTKESCYVCV